MERSDILRGNEHKICSEKKAKHCPFGFAAKTGSKRIRTKVLLNFFQKIVQSRVKLWSLTAVSENFIVRRILGSLNPFYKRKRVRKPIVSRK